MCKLSAKSPAKSRQCKHTFTFAQFTISDLPLYKLIYELPKHEQAKVIILA
jgi:hypothetical protein